MITALFSSLTLLFHPARANCGPCQMSGPTGPNEAGVWLENIRNDRKNFNFGGGVFDKVPWTQTSYIQPQSHPYDRYFYDPDKGYTIDRFLKDLKDRYGGIDSVLVWPTYTNIGVDDRNQFDYFRVMPGGLEGVANATAQLKAAGVRVLWPYNPWDTGTHREPLSDADTFAKLLKQTGGDGFNGDTMGSVPKEFWDAAEKLDYPLAFEPEGGGADYALDWTTMGWGYWNYPDGAPIVDRFKWLTSGKFLTNVCDRWAKSRTNNVQFAWFNGDGFESWENVWGTWNGITPYDGEAIRRVGTMLRFFGGKGYLQSPDWVPHTTDVWQSNVYASKFPIDGAVVYTIINRGSSNITAGVIVEAGKKYYDCYHGKELFLDHPPLTDAPLRYSKYQGGNCYNGHGGTEIDGNAITGKTAVECAALCDSNSQCQCFTYKADSQECWRRSDCYPQYFQWGGSYDTYVKAEGYTTYNNLNAYNGHGGVSFGDQRDNNGNGIAVADGAACQKLCDSTDGCVCATSGAGKCWPLKACAPSYFANGGGTYSVHVSLERSPGMGPPSGANVTFPLEAHGYGCVVQTDQPADADLAAHLKTMSTVSARALGSYDAEWKYLPQTMVKTPATKLQTSAPAGTVKIPKNSYNFATSGVMIEGDDAHGVDVQFPWEDHPQRSHSRTMTLGPFYMDKFPVTNANYSAYLADSGYKPKDSYNWLKNWGGASTPPYDLLDKPVTYVGLEEARAYCAWKGARLPQVYEWQYAAQGTDGRTYPWGWGSDTWRYPGQRSGNSIPGPESVTAHVPNGDSPFGVSDLIGNVWQYTSEFQDDHTRSVLLRGGSNYYPTGSHWYFPQAKQLNRHNKYFLMNNRYERAGTIGFRCIFDAADSSTRHKSTA